MMKIQNKIVLSLVCLLACFQMVRAENNAKALKIGYVKADYIFSLLPETKRLESDYKVFEQQLRNNLEKQFTELQEKVQAFEKGYATMTEAVKKQKQTELGMLQANLQKLEIEAQESLTNKHLELLKPLHERMQKAIQEVAQENDYTHVFNSDVGGLSILMYADQTYDLSDLVIKKLGASVAKEAENKPSKKVMKKGKE